MIGNNEFKFNQATMIEALQLWCDKNFVAPPIVTAVKIDNTLDDSFRVLVKQPEPTP